MVKKLIKILCCFNGLLLLFLFLAVATGQLEHEKEVDNYCIEDENGRYKMTGDMQYRFTFRNDYTDIKNMILRFHGCAGHEQGILSVTICDNWEEYYSYQVPLKALSNDTFYLYTREITGLKEGFMYDLIVTVTDVKEEFYLEIADENLLNIRKVFHDEERVKNASPVLGITGTKIELSDDFGELLKMLGAGNGLILLGFVTFYIICREPKRKKVILQLQREWKELPSKYIIRAGIFAVILIGIILYSCFGDEELVHVDESEFWTVSQSSEYEYLPLKEGIVVQQFKAQHDILDEFYIIFDNYAGDEGELKIELTDAKGNIYYEWSQQISNISTSIFYLIADVEQELQRGKTYYLSIAVDNPDCNITVRTVKEQDFHKSMEALYVDGDKHPEQCAYMYFSYQYEWYYPAFWVTAVLIAYGVLVIFSLVRKQRIILIGNVCLAAAMPLAAYFFIESMSGNLETISMKMASRNLMVLIGGYLFLYMLAGRRWGIYIMNWLAAILGIANYYVSQFRGAELTVYDIRSVATATTVAANYVYVVTPVVFTSILLVVLLTVLWGTCIDRQKTPTRRINLIKRGFGGCGSAIIVLLLITYYLRLDNYGFSMFDLSKSISQYGWVYSNAFLIKNSSIEKPDTYSAESVERIIAGVGEKENCKTTVPENIIVIMNESLADLENIRELDNNMEYMPFIKSLDENCVKGTLHVNTFGGGTCITEYEFLTGNTKIFFPSVASPYISICKEEEAGLCSTLKAQNYHTVAMHPYKGSNWNRDKVYPIMGFDEFLAEEDFEGADRERYFVSDLGNYQKIIEYYEAFEGEEGLFIFDVTMQNHGGYDINNGTIETEVYLTEYEDATVDTYLSLIYRSDQAFEYLISYFEQVEEPTMIVMFGDHLPSLPTDFYTYLFGGKDTAERSDEEKSLMYMTPYLIWTNYKMVFPEAGDMSANYLGSYVLECAGLEMTGYDRFLSGLRKEIPVIGTYGIIQADGEFVPYDEMTDDLLNNYKQLQYLRIKDCNSAFYSLFRMGQ